MMHKFILFLGVLLSVSLSAQTEVNRNAVDPNLAPFYHGVASGDPAADGLYIWTRYTPEFIGESSFPVSYRVALDTGMQQLVDSGTVEAKLMNDYTVKVWIHGLDPNTFYYYDFQADERYSIRGRSKTAPAPNDDEPMRFGLVSCSNYEYGYFTPYKNLADRNDVDAIIHLGDYIYEYEVGGYSANIPGREHEPAHEIISLDDYRLRYSHYRLDPDLRRLHQQYPFINVWDDHETADNSWKDGAVNHDEATEGDWTTRKNNGIKAFAEWIPSQLDPSTGIIYRTLKFGKNMDLHMLDTRLIGRDEQAETGSPEIFLPGRSLLGQTQFEWFKQQLSQNKNGWNIVGQQVMMAPLTLGGIPINPDQWDGYQEERQLLYQHLANNNLNNMVVLTGDIHTSWANDLPTLLYNPLTGENSAGVEFVCTSVTSPGLDLGEQNINDLTPSVLQLNNTHMKYINLIQKGYMILDVRAERVQGEWWYVHSITDPLSEDYYATSYLVEKGETSLSQGIGPSVRRTFMAEPAPLHPWAPADEDQDDEEEEDEIDEEDEDESNNDDEEEDDEEEDEEEDTEEDEEEDEDDEEEVGVSSNDFILFGIYPNPATEKLILQFQNAGDFKLRIHDQLGKLILTEEVNPMDGVNYLELNVSDWRTGLYFLDCQTNGATKRLGKFVKH